MQPILTIDLGSGEAGLLNVPPEWEREYLGGASLAARMLYEHLRAELDPLSPQAPLLFMTGPLTGTYGPAVGRFVVCGRSPHTGLWGESNCGGFWGPELRQAGYDGLWITGRAPHPVYIWVHEGGVEVRDARHLWGLDTYQTQAALERELSAGVVRIATIGPAGEAALPFALILCDHGRVAGRTGMGAVMGAKNLKAIAVQGQGEIPLADRGSFAALRSEANRALRQDGVTLALRALGTANAADYFDYLGEMPKRYFHAEIFEGAARISGASVSETILAGVTACHACVIACGRLVRLEDGGKRKGPEYETLVGFGPNLWLDDPVFVTRMGELCDRYGMDSISLSNTLGLAFTLYEKGVISEKDTDGIVLRWGDKSAVEALVHRTARRQGFGAYLAEGARALGRRFAAEEEAIQVNGLEVAYHDPRGASGMALVYATSPRGACHNQSDYFMVDIGQADATLGLELYPRLGGAEKAANVARHQDWRTWFNSLVMCYFANVEPQMIVDLVRAATGMSWDLAEALQAGERGWNLKRVINYRLGLRREQEKLPRIFLQPYPEAGAGTQGFVPPFEPMLEAYYRARGWEMQTGLPSRRKLTELGLDWVASDLEIG